MMKKSGIFVAAAASVTAISSAVYHNPNSQIHFSSPQDDVSGRNGGNSSKGGAAFAPRFDGLRFIETLITGHR
ncbi:hypothetical protein DCAR_0311005 [Daucus carota subsp. sativus]|uniref:Uncharacterized protein n=1 Tax=Daucus carota subsp. sativus TaxID=79200 RepID=A0A166ABE7_DAUCS|nr:hypothetical protein DCAR_0311005 [Daucus carota subsp. sativus]